MAILDFEANLDQSQRQIFSSLNSPKEIQAFLDSIPYSPENANRCPLSVLRDRQAHCLDGALFAAAALRRLGYPPILIDLLPEPGTDDDHVLAIYKVNGSYGALAKSNYSGLRYREPVYRPLRELVMSYFDDFFNVYGQKTLRSYTIPLRLSRIDSANWMWSDAGADEVEQRLGKLRKITLLTDEMAAGLSAIDPLSFQAGMLGANEAGLYKPQV
jgi:hypothetical protein